MNRRLKRDLGVLAIAACAPLVFGCATTNRYIVAPEEATQRPVGEAFLPSSAIVHFDDAGGRIDLATQTLTGRKASGEDAVVSLDRVNSFRFQADPRERGISDLDPLREGSAWRPGGDVHYVALQTGDVLDLRHAEVTIDPLGQTVHWAAGDQPTALDFADISYIQTRDSHPWRTFAAIVLSASAAAAMAIGIALSNMEILGD
jgi:hypothetical protein